MINGISTPLNAYLSRAGVSSRRKAIELIQSGSVSVNGAIVKHPAYRVSGGDIVKVGKLVVRREVPIYIVLNKPKGCVTTLSDEFDRRTVKDLLVGIRQRVYPIGRLDYNTTGILLLTNDGAMAQKLAHPKYDIKKEYHITCTRPISTLVIQKIERGVKLADGVVTVDAIRPIASNKVSLVLHSGRYRVIRRLFEKLGYTIAKLDRVSYAGIIKKGLSPGSWRMMSKKEVDRMRKNR